MAECHIIVQLPYYTGDKIVSNIDGLVQERRIAIANALQLRLSCTNPSIL